MENVPVFAADRWFETPITPSAIPQFYRGLVLPENLGHFPHPKDSVAQHYARRHLKSTKKSVVLLRRSQLPGFEVAQGDSEAHNRLHLLGNLF